MPFIFKVLSLFFLLTTTIFAQKAKKTTPPSTADAFPVPPASDVRLFYVQRSTNTNTVVYDANLAPDRKYDSKNPVRAYWIRYGERGQKEELNYIQRTVGYGFESKAVASETNTYDGWVVAYKKRRFRLSTDAKGQPIALFQINGKMQVLQRVFINLEETGHLIPKVLFVELWGRDQKTGVEVYEKFKP